ncbi:MAG: cytochrome b561 domain-containing protein [Geminicoccales bacterium]
MTASLLRRLRFGHTVLSGACLLLSLGVFAAPTLADAADQEGADIVAWLMAPTDPARAHDVDWITSWHGRLMVLIWCVLFPAGIMTARFFKIMPGQDWPSELDNKRWWRTHLSTQYIGGGLLLLALGLAFYASGTGLNDAVGWHQILGWTVAVLAAWQFLGGWLRGSKGGPTDPAPDGSPRGDHYDMTRRRRIFEYAHKAGGYLALLTACIAIITGLHAANAPRWMWLSIGGWWAVIIALAVWLQARGFARDTYEAIWGPGAEHPGNNLPPIGLGVRRSSDGTSADHGD